MRRFKVWHAVAIILSLLWIFGAWAYQDLRREEVAADAAAKAFEACTAAELKREQEGRGFHGEHCSTGYAADFSDGYVKAALPWEGYLRLILLPLAILWAVALTADVTMSRLRRRREPAADRPTPPPPVS